MFALDALLERLPDALVDDPAGKRLRLLGEQLPDALSRRIGLEARLGIDPTVDLLLLAATPRELGILAGTDPHVQLGDALTATAPWQGAARLARRAQTLIDTGSPLPPGIWLELDATATELVPALFTAAAPDPGHPAAHTWDTVTTVGDILREVAGADPPAALMTQIARVVDSPLTVRQIGCFTGRPNAGVRLFCAHQVGTPLTRALTAAGWRGAADAVEHWAQIAYEFGDRVHIGLDLTATGTLPTIGLEITLADAAQPHQDPRWAKLLDLLLALDLGTDDKRDAVLALGRAYELRLPHLRRYRQGLHHLKISVSGAGEASVKVYFGAYEVTE